MNGSLVIVLLVSSSRFSVLFLFLFGGGKEGNVSCTITPSRRCVWDSDKACQWAYSPVGQIGPAYPPTPVSTATSFYEKSMVGPISRSRLANLLSARWYKVNTLLKCPPATFHFFFVGKGGNASCTVTPKGAVCGTLHQGLLLGLFACWTYCPVFYPLKPTPAAVSAPSCYV